MLVVDNEGRLDEACVGDLMALEAAGAGLAGIVIWGLHRDSVEIREIGLPVFSLGSMPTGPLRLDPRADDALDAAPFGEWTITRDDLVFADDDGVLFVPAAAVDDVLTRRRGGPRHRARAGREVARRPVAARPAAVRRLPRDACCRPHADAPPAPRGRSAERSKSDRASYSRVID